MFYLFSEIYNYKQLSRLIPKDLALLETHIKSLMNGFKGKFLYAGDGITLFSFLEEDLFPDLVDASLALQKLLLNHTYELHGFNLLIEKIPTTEPEKVLKEMRTMLFDAQSEEVIWVGSASFPSMSQYVTLSQEGSLSRIINKKEGYLSLSIDASQFIRLESKISAVIDAILFAHQEEPGLVLVFGPRGTGVRHTVRESTATLLKNHPWPRLFVPARCHTQFDTLRQGLNNEFIDKVPEYLSTTERTVWMDKEMILRMFSPSIPNEYEQGSDIPVLLEPDIAIIYTLFLAAYGRYMKEKLLPPIVVCEDIHRFPQGDLTLLGRAFRPFLASGDIIPVLASAFPCVPKALATVPCKTVGIPLLEAQDIRNLVDNYYPDMMPIDDQGISVLNTATGGRPIALFHLLRKMKKEEITIDSVETLFSHAEDPFAISRHAAARLGQDEQKILYTLCMAGGLMDMKYLKEFLDSIGIDKEQTRIALNRLGSLGFFDPSVSMMPMIPRLDHALERGLDVQAEHVRKSLTQFLFGLWKKEIIKGSDEEIYRILAKEGNISKALEVLSCIIRKKLDNRDLKGVSLFLGNSEPCFKRNAGKQDRIDFDTMLIAGKLRCALLANDWESARKIESVRQFRGDKTKYQTELELEQARYFYRTGEIRKAMNGAKLALLFFQENGEQSGEAACTIELGKIMLAEGKLEEAIEYFSIAKDIKGQTRYLYMRGAVLEAVALYLFGNLSRAMLLCERAYNDAVRYGYREFQLFLAFMKARLQFSFGRYENSVALFQEALSIAELYAFAQAKTTLSCWLARSYVYLGCFQEGLRILCAQEERKETLFFLAEAHAFMGNIQEAVKCIDCSHEIGAPSVPLPGETISWQDGFSGIEGYLCGLPQKNSVFAQMVRAFRSYLCKDIGFLEKGIAELEKITRSEKFSENDPYNCQYFYYYSQLLKEMNRANPINSFTILSKALKYVQERASKIDDPVLKNQYLWNNYWNAQLLQEARRQKLI